MSANILVVEDSAAMRAMISGVVKASGHSVVEAESGEEACELFSQEKIDLAVLDVNMDGINGFETCRRLRALAKDRWFPVIYLSATDSADNIVEGLDAGGDAYVTKPVNPRVLEAILNAMGRIADMRNELDVANKRLERLAAYDGLTQIPNRRSFDETLIRYLLQARREQTDLALLLIDVDHFKAYNDYYGHQKGDEALMSTATALVESLLRPVDMVARYGGEEFAVLLPQTDAVGAAKVAERISANLVKANITHEASKTAEHLTASVGIAIASQGQMEPNPLIEQADRALYAAKSAGRNGYQVFSD